VSQDSKPAIVRSTDEQRYNPRNSPRRKLSAFVDSLLSTLVDSEGDDDGKSTRKKDCLESTASTWGVSANRELDNIVKG
jgi:hypothetical protein